MQVPNCRVCGGFDGRCHEIKFADYKSPTLTDPPGGANGIAFFCDAHLADAQRLSFLKSSEAIAELKKNYAR